MTYSYDRARKAADQDNSWGLGYYPLPPQLSHLGRFADNLAPTKLVGHKFFVNDGVHMLTAKVNTRLSVMAEDMKTLLRLGLLRIQCNELGTLDFYFGGFKGSPPVGGAELGGQEGEDVEPILPLNRGGWTLWILKDRATRWRSTLHNPQGGSSGTGSYTSATAAFADTTRRVNWEGAEKLLVVVAKWDVAQEKYVASKQFWVDIPASGPVPVPKLATQL